MASTTRTGPVWESTEFVPEPGTLEAQDKVHHENAGTLRSRAEQALATNTAFLANPTPTNAQTLAQVKALTRQSSALTRLALAKLDSTEGT